MALKKYKLTPEGEAAAKLSHKVITKSNGADVRIHMDSITDDLAEILHAQQHPFVTLAKKQKV